MKTSRNPNARSRRSTPTETPMNQPALFSDDDVQTEGYAQPEPREEDAVEETGPEAEAA